MRELPRRQLRKPEQEFALIEEADGKQRKLYRIDKSIRALESITFGTMELLATHAALAVLQPLKETPLFRDLTRVQQKIRGFLSQRHNGGLSRLAEVFASHRRNYVDDALQGETIDFLTDAIARLRWCRVLYHGKWLGTTKRHRFRPLKLVWHRGSVYLLCSLDGFDDITTLAVHRIAELEVETETFSPPKNSPEAHIESAFGIFVSDTVEDVEIHFDPAVAWRIEERTFHPEEQKTRVDNGKLIYKLQSSSQWEIVPWVLSFGGMAELVAPLGWRTSLAQASADLLSRHQR